MIINILRKNPFHASDKTSSETESIAPIKIVSLKNHCSKRGSQLTPTQHGNRQ